MLRHVVLLRFTEGTSRQQVEAATVALKALPARIPALRGYHVGPDLGLADNHYDYAVVAEFDDEAGWRTYMDDTEHDRIRKELLSPLVADRAVVQFTA